MESTDQGIKKIGFIEKFMKFFELITKIGSLIVLIMWIIATFSQLNIHSKYNISYSLFNLNLVESIPVMIMASSLVVLLVTPVLLGIIFKESKIKWPLYIVTIIISLFFIGLNYNFYLKLPFGISEKMIDTLVIFHIPAFWCYQYIIVKVMEPKKSKEVNRESETVVIKGSDSSEDRPLNGKNKLSKKVNIPLFLLAFVVAGIYLYMTIINIFGLVLEKKTSHNFYDIIEKNGIRRVIIMKYNDSYITQDFVADEDNDTITIYTDRCFIEEQNDSTISSVIFSHEKLINLQKEN